MEQYTAMTNDSLPETLPTPENTPSSVPEVITPPESIEEPTESFADLLQEFERSHSHKAEPGSKQLQGTVVSVSADQVLQEGDRVSFTPTKIEGALA